MKCSLHCNQLWIFVCTVFVLLTLCLSVAVAGSDENRNRIGNRWVDFAANFDTGFRNTQYFERHHDAAVIQWDSRFSLWFPPSSDTFSWGIYGRVAGIKSSQAEAWENAWLAGPGGGFQVYPFSFPSFRGSDNKSGSPNSAEPSSNTVGNLLGPLRLFAEYNRTDYFGKENSWRPSKQACIGADYWKAIHVNNPAYSWWVETWNGLHWQSSNEFDEHYKTTIFGNAVRFGLRKPDSGFISVLTPYIAGESSLTNKNHYYWENRLLLGGGLRIAPRLRGRYLSRFVLYGEYLTTGAYYYAQAPSSTPRFDVRFGVSASLGDWYNKY